MIASFSRALAEGLTFSQLYPVFQSLEDTGNVRRGYFVQGLPGVQFAMPPHDIPAASEL